MPSNFVILKQKISGYNNVLTTASKEMKFGVNKDVNYTSSEKNLFRDIASGVNVNDNVHNGSSSSSSSVNDSAVRDFPTTGGTSTTTHVITFSSALVVGLLFSKFFL